MQSLYLVWDALAQLPSQAAFSHWVCSSVAVAQAELAPSISKHPPRLSPQKPEYAMSGPQVESVGWLTRQEKQPELTPADEALVQVDVALVPRHVS
jgi:hypothetical protein